MTDYAVEVIECLATWFQKLKSCNGDPECIRKSGQELRENLDVIFPPSKKLEFDNDKINYIFSTIFFLSNRLSKALIGLAETDKAFNNLVSDESKKLKDDNDDKDLKEFQIVINRILSDYY